VTIYVVWAHANIIPAIISKSGNNLFINDSVDIVGVIDEFIHIMALPIIIALIDKKTTAFEMFKGSDVIEYGKFI